MSTRIRDENAIHIPNQRKAPINKKVINENTLRSITRPTLASSLKVSSKPELKSKGSRTILAPINKAPISNATPNAKPVSKSGGEKGTVLIKPKPLASKLPTSQTQGTFQTPRANKKVLPKSTKKALNVYTPARQEVEEVEYTHPKPAGLEDGPPSPIRDAMSTTGDISPGGDTFPEEEIGMTSSITELPSGNLDEPI